MRSRAIQVLAIIAVSCAAVAGLSYILQRHAQQAESFPVYSSFRTLPEGTSVLYQALGSAPGMTAERNVLPFGAIHFDDTAILMLGIQLSSLAGNEQWFGEMEELAGAGNRVIIGLLPHHYRFIGPEKDLQTTAMKHWGIRLAYVRDVDFRDEEEDKLMAGWPMYFAESTKWQTMRQESGHAVTIQRVEGKGSIVLVANPYPFSNAAMVDDRQTEYLTDLIGPVHHTVFDETHFGIEETGSIAGLARRFRLQGLLLGLLLTACLFIWKSAAGFPPPARAAQSTQSVTGEDSSSAFINLLRRNIKKEDILSTCVEAWRKMYQRKAGPGLATAIDLAVGGSKTPTQTYAQIQKLLATKPHQS
jgi:hypothetical protein